MKTSTMEKIRHIVSYIGLLLFVVGALAFAFNYHLTWSLIMAVLGYVTISLIL